MSTNNWILVGVAALIVITGAVFYFRSGSAHTNLGSQQATDTRKLLTYYDPRYGVAFNFPETYTVQDHDSTAGAKHHTIVVGDKASLASTTKNSEGSPVITMDIYDNPSKQSPVTWIKNNNFSNYRLGKDSTLSTTTVAGISAYAYPWDGLYPSTSIVFPENGKMYMLSVNYNSPNDQIYKDFARFVASVQFDQ